MKHSGTRCRPGDLAVVIAAKYKANIGKIVRVMRPYDCEALSDWRA